MKKIVYSIMLFGFALTAQANWLLLDNFDGYDNSSITTIGANSGGDCTAGAWDGVWDGTSNARIYDNATDPGDNELAVWGMYSQGAGGWRGASTDLANNFGTDFSFADNSTNTIFFQFQISDTNTFDCMFGLTDNQSVLDNNDSWQDFAVMPFLSGGGAGVADFKATTASGDQIAITNVAAKTWYNVWLVVDTANNLYDVYTSTGTANGTLAIKDAIFRNGKGAGALTAFGIAQNQDGTVRLDNIYVDKGHANTTYAIPPAYTTVYSDGFNGTGSASLNGTTPDTTTGGATWSAHASMLDNGYPINADDASALLPITLESNKLYRLTVNLMPAAVTPDNDWLGFGFNESATVSGAGAVPATNAGRFTDPGINGKVWAILREAASNTTGDQDVQLFSSVTSGEIGTTETDASFDGFTNHIAMIELSTTNGVLAARMLIDGTDITAGFQTVSGVSMGDVHGVGITHNNTTQTGVHFNSFKLEVSTSYDGDNDGLPDAWEQQIIDANTNDAITTIYDVLPGDDFDGDGFSNLQEYQLGLDPTVPNASDTDTDGDYLPDLWEFDHFGNLNYNSYDDPDGDGYNNQAERIAGTDPLLKSDHPSWTAPGVAFLRDSDVATNACLMPAGIYGHVINGQSFQDQIVDTFDGYQYTAYYDTVGSVQKVCIARRTVSATSTGAWEVYQTDSEFVNGDEPSWDAHNVVAFGICPQDGTLHVAYDHHDNTLRYRRSVVGLCTTNKAAWGAGMLNPEQNWMVNASTPEYDVTYPQFITTPNGGLVLDRRMGTSGNGDQYFQFYKPSTGTWSPKVQFTSRTGNYNGSTSRCAYLNGFDFGPDGTIHVTWTWREGAGSSNHDICYAYSPDMGTNWYNNAGTNIADTSLGQYISLDTPGIIIKPTDMHHLLINQQAQCVDNDGRVHILMLHRREDPGYDYPNITTANFTTLGTAYYHYFRDPVSGKWTQRRIPPNGYPVGSRPCIGYDAQGNVYAAYLSYPAGTDVVPGYISGKLVIASASKNSDYTDWAVMQVLNTDFNGEPLLDQARLLNDNILSVYIQENSTASSSDGIPTPLHVVDFAVNVPEPELASKIACTFMKNDVVISAYGQTGTNYQLQATTDLTNSNGWSNVGSPIGGLGHLIALPDADGLMHNQTFYRVLSSPTP